MEADKIPAGGGILHIPKCIHVISRYVILIGRFMTYLPSLISYAANYNVEVEVGRTQVTITSTCLYGECAG